MMRDQKKYEKNCSSFKWERAIFINYWRHSIYVVYYWYGYDGKASNENTEKEWLEAGKNKQLSPYLCKKGYDRPVPVPFHKGKDDNLGDFAMDILKEANIDPKTLKEIQKWFTTAI